MHTILHLGALALTILVLSRIVPSVHVRSVGAAIAVAIVFSVLNFFLGWFIKAALFVPALMTLGLLFVFVPFIVNTVLLWLTDKVMASFEIESFAGLLFSAAVITVVNGVFYAPLLHSVWQGHYGPGQFQSGSTRWI
jgi:putative membrane protein